MDRKVLMMETRTNGYLCGCCGRNWYEEEWMDENEMIPFEGLVNQAFRVNPSNEYSVTDLNYYDEKEAGIYGFSTSYGRDYCKVFISIGESEYLIKEDKNVLMTKEELMEKYTKFLIEKGEK